MAEINFTVKEADVSNCYGERLDEIAEKALEPLIGFSKTLIALGNTEAEFFADDIGNTVKGLANNARSEILGAIQILFKHFGKISIKRAKYHSDLQIPPESMTGGILWWPGSTEKAIEIIKPQAAPEGGV